MRGPSGEGQAASDLFIGKVEHARFLEQLDQRSFRNFLEGAKSVRCPAHHVAFVFGCGELVRHFTDLRMGDAHTGGARADLNGAHTCRNGRAMQRRPRTNPPPEYPLHMRGIARHRAASRGIAWHRVASRGIAWHRVASRGIAWHRVASRGNAWHRVASR